ncbi:hypothetical protein [Catenulispora rubra]|uniref:hypothetical protein n=1 Tax=Catenulispora rubra TaxID=280293 RepID=UPI001E53973A|nr:hypothetical protein [Catenulispora rubra]
MLAAAVDHLAIGNWMFSAVNRDEDSPMPEAPEPIPRPGEAEASSSPDGEAEPPPSGDVTMPAPWEIARFFG